jgi:triosephosphate isomerase
MVESSQRKYFIGGNWKCNGNQASVKELIENTINKLEFDQNKVGNQLYLLMFIEVSVAPVALHLQTAQ